MPEHEPVDEIAVDPEMRSTTPRPVAGWKAPLAIAVVLVLMLVAYVGWPGAPSEPVRAPAGPPAALPPTVAPALSSAAASMPDAGEPVVPVDAAASAMDLPALEESDLVFARWLEEAFGREGMAQLRINDFARRFVATVDNLGREHAPARLWPVNPAAGRFGTVSHEGRTVIEPDNPLRYAPFVLLLESVDPASLATLYRHAYPLLLQSYGEIGFPGKSFHARLLAVIDHLLAAPEPEGEIALLPIEVRGATPPSQPWRYLSFADPALEQLTAGQKLMVRMGLVNERRLKQVLTRLRAALDGTRARTLKRMPVDSLQPARQRWPDPARPDSSAAVLAGFVVLYLLLDWLSFVHPMRGTSITPWNPQAALAVALLAWQPRWWWLVAPTLVLAVVARNWPAPQFAEMVAAGTLSAGYLALALALRRWLGAVPSIATRRDFVVFLLLVAAGCALAALLYVGPLIALGAAPAQRWAAALARSWIGDAVGLIVMLPVVLALCDAARRLQTRAMLAMLEWWLVAALALLAAWAVFGRAQEEQFKYFYLLFLPVAWAAARFGFVGAVWSAALVQMLLILAVQSSPYSALTVFELHLLMCVLGAMGLLLGTTVDEREQSERALRASLHLAAAGDMAAALAHELNQPLTALRSYARSLQLLAEQQAVRALPNDPRLEQVAAKLVHEANRAGEVVRRLKDFFHHRSTELQPVKLDELLHGLVASQRPRAEAAGIRIDTVADANLPPVWIDRVQIEVVVRNLLANAVDAAADDPCVAATVTVRLSRTPTALLLAVDDTGRGISAEELPGLFESRPSTKPGGMGIGLFISRAIVESHDGRLWAEPGTAGRFRLSLPLTHAGEDDR